MSSLLTIVISFQLSLGANDPKAFYKSTKLLVEKIKPMLKAVINDMPTTSPAFGKYKTELETFVKQFEADKAKKIPCFFKTFGLMNNFVDLLDPYEKDNASKEAKEVLKIFNKHGFKELDSEFIKVALGYDLSKLGNDLEKLANSNDKFLLELC